MLTDIRTSKAIQRQVDRAVASLDRDQKVQSDQGKIKSKRGGPVEVLVSQKVLWPHKYIFFGGGGFKQRISYDQLNMAQFAQGFVKNVLDESDSQCREHMLTYFCDLMEDANDFSWASAKASHAVLLCEMERRALDWSDTNRLDRIRRAHVQRHTNFTKQNWTKGENSKRPWFCKPLQTGVCNFNKDHEVGGKTHRHVCAFCLTQGRQMTHAEKDCFFAKKVATSKNE